MSTIEALSAIYFETVHPLLPILNETEYRHELESRTILAPLVHAVCLVAAKATTAEPHLRHLQAGDAPVPVRQFCSRLYSSLVTALGGRVALKKLTTIRIMALLSFHHEGSDGAEQAACYNAQAIHRAQSLAMHLRRPNDEGSEMKRIFWCLWTLDRFIAAIHSRPCTMADADIAVEPITPEQSGWPAFDVLFRIAKLLNEVIALYRPTNPESITGIETGFPGFEQILEETNGWSLSSSTLALLSHRLKSIHALPAPTAARMRQQLSAIRIIRSLEDPMHLRSLGPFPILVYATGLALSISYQQLRYSRLAIDQQKALQDFNTACRILQELSQKWESADIVASLALKISERLNKVPRSELIRFDLLTSEVRENEGHVCPPQHVHPTGTTVTNTTENVVVDSGDPALGSQWDADTLGLFDGMDDVSWMFLGAENPASFDLSLPLQDTWPDNASQPEY
ncbi:unnamed protein product [Clonostachys rosea]|uniref:Xylanolytic transcriptional activator regulatory domain-containing protein n=1 Tax=Bionectria ochroleuca TaxID=29856 RepID=A0ABY6URZ6_BIOOC|nr:unnamed protein product [Clonostachys rosea]